MAAIRIIGGDLARALVVLAMFVFLLGAPAANAGTGGIIAQQAGISATAFSSLCGGGHDQAPLACHAPNACCRPDQAMLPPTTPAAEPAFRGVAAVAYASFRPGAQAIAPRPPFRSRAPPV